MAEKKTCHDCGLEDIDACEGKNIHRSSRANLSPCKYCKRNPEPHQANITDFYSETWMLLSDGTPTIEDPDPHEQTLLRFLHEVVSIYEPAESIKIKPKRR